MENSKELNWLLQKAKENTKKVYPECTEYEVRGAFRYSFILALKNNNKWDKDLSSETNTTWWFGNRDNEKIQYFVSANIKTGSIIFSLFMSNE